MIARFKNWIRQKKCKHEYGWYTERPILFAPISGETRYYICKKCGKQNGSYYARYEGGGFK